MADPRRSKISEIFPDFKSDYQITPAHHVLFWLAYFSFNTLRWWIYYNDFMLSLKGNLVEFPLHIILCYVTIYYLIPRFIYKRKFLIFSGVMLGLLVLMAFVKFQFTYWFISHNVWPEGPTATSVFSFNYAVVMMLGELYVVSFVTAIKITADWVAERKRAAKLEQTQLETELRFLRSQISPHFFFNTLNNIYSLSLEKSEKTPEIVLKLSELMRYLLYETKPKKQQLKKEINCIQNYLELERIRYGSQLKINFNITGNVDEKKIAPMLLIPFIENAFKHGASQSIGLVFINIDLAIDGDFLNFKISNTLPIKNRNKPKKYEGGIGIDNIKKRLRLGYGKNGYSLDIFEDKKEFVVNLKLKVI